jgi:hypothetical protein
VGTRLPSLDEQLTLVPRFIGVEGLEAPSPVGRGRRFRPQTHSSEPRHLLSLGIVSMETMHQCLLSFEMMGQEVGTVH